MSRKILTISMAGNPAGQSLGILEGEVLPPENPLPTSGDHIRRAIHTIHDLGMRTGKPKLRDLALNAALELRILTSLAGKTIEHNSKEFPHA